MVPVKLPYNYLSRIPIEHKREFIDKICSENFARMIVIAVLLVVVEPFIAILTETPETVSFYLSLAIAMINLVFIPLLYDFKKNIKQKSKFQIMLLQTLYLIGILAGGISLFLYAQPSVAASSTYFLAVFTIAAFMVMPPVISAVLLLASNFTLIMLLPLFLNDPEAITTMYINTLSATAVAWIVNQMVSYKEVVYYLNEKIIIEKNSEMELKNQELNELTMRDSMTNLLNHKNSMKKLKEEVDRAKRISYPLSVAMVDLDNFKLVNDSYGHQTGDEVLVQVAKILSESCRSTDVVGRYGGEEFIVIMPDTNGRDAALLMERIQTRIKETSFKDGIHVTLSCGISELNGESVHGILKSSDVMLYEAKKKGKNRIEVLYNEDKKKSAAIN